MVSLRRRARLLARRAGIDLVRYPQSEPLWRVAQILEQSNVDLVFDVGANNGGYAAAIRRHGYKGSIASFEPLDGPFLTLQEAVRGDAGWTATQCAIGAQRGQATFNVAGNAGASSSLLPMLDAHTEAAPESAYVAATSVEVRRLDDLINELAPHGSGRIFLKADVQGFEKEVLNGARELLDSGRVIGLQLELSFTPLYEGGMRWEEGFEEAAALGMTLVSLDRGFTDPSGRMLQADAVFLRD